MEQRFSEQERHLEQGRGEEISSNLPMWSILSIHLGVSAGTETGFWIGHQG